MAISDKLTFLNTTKSQLKDMINYGLDDNNKITSSTTFRNYVSSIFNAFLEALRTPDTLFTNLPKKSGSGSVISLNDTANAPMRIELGASELSQSGTPSPSSPQAVHTISGDNTIRVSNSDNSVSQEAEVDLSSKNLFNPYKVKAENNATLIITPTGFNITRTHGSGYGDEFIASYTIENLKANTIYTFNFDVETELNIGNGSIYVYSDNLFGTALTKSNYASSGNNHKWNITTSSNGKMVIGFYGTTSAQNKIIKLTNVQLEEGSTKTNYIEYYDYGFYGKIGNYEDKFIRTSGKNLFDKNNVRNGYRLGGDGTYYAEAGYSASEFIEVKPNTSYTRNKNINIMTPICTYQQDGTFIERITSGSTITTPNNCYYIKTAVLNTDLDTTMLNEGTTALDYEPYGSNEWYIKKNIGKVVLDGSETGWWEYRVGTGYHTYGVPYGNMKAGNVVSNKFVSSYSMTINASGEAIYSLADNYLYICIDDTRLGTISTNGFKTWLTNNNVIVYGISTSPTYTQITGTLAEQLENVYQKLLSYTGQTNISQANNDLSFNLSVSAIEEL